MVKADLITGFLGSGKTTFIIKYAKYLKSMGERIAILENDLDISIFYLFLFVQVFYL